MSADDLLPFCAQRTEGGGSVGGALPPPPLLAGARGPHLALLGRVQRAVLGALLGLQVSGHPDETVREGVGGEGGGVAEGPQLAARHNDEDVYAVVQHAGLVPLSLRLCGAEAGLLPQHAPLRHLRRQLGPEAEKVGAEEVLVRLPHDWVRLRLAPRRLKRVGHPVHQVALLHLLVPRALRNRGLHAAAALVGARRGNGACGRRGGRRRERARGGSAAPGRES